MRQPQPQPENAEAAERMDWPGLTAGTRHGSRRGGSASIRKLMLPRPPCRHEPGAGTALKIFAVSDSSRSVFLPASIKCLAKHGIGQASPPSGSSGSL